MQEFIYVFCEEDRDSLIDSGYALLKQDDANNIFIFLNREEQRFAKLKLPHMLSDTLTF